MVAVWAPAKTAAQKRIATEKKATFLGIDTPPIGDGTFVKTRSTHDFEQYMLVPVLDDLRLLDARNVDYECVEYGHTRNRSTIRRIKEVRDSTKDPAETG